VNPPLNARGTSRTLSSFGNAYCEKAGKTNDRAVAVRGEITQEANCSMKTPKQTSEEIEQKMVELARKYLMTHDKQIIEELYRLAGELEKMEKLEKQ